MAVVDVLARVQEIHALAASASSPAAPAPGSTSFGSLLAALPGAVASAGAPVALDGASPAFLRPLQLDVDGGTGVGERALAVAQAEVGVAEEPPGSNEGARIAEYRAATRDAYAGAPWCAYFASWVASQAGAPLGEEGQGYGAVEEVEAWARRTGRFVEPGTQPRPGDLILYGGRHMGIVESVEPDGSLRTIEGNYADGVTRVNRSPAEATGFVRLG